MSELAYIHDQLYFNNKEVEKLNAVERGQLQDFCDLDVAALEDLQNDSESLQDLLNDIDDLTCDIEYDELTADQIKERLERLYKQYKN